MNSKDLTDLTDFCLFLYQRSWEGQNIYEFNRFDRYDGFDMLFFVLVPGEPGK